MSKAFLETLPKVIEARKRNSDLTDQIPKFSKGEKLGKYEIEGPLEEEPEFGAAYSCSDKGGKYIVKLELANDEMYALRQEVLILSELQKLRRYRHFPVIRDKARHDSINFCVFSPWGPCLVELRRTRPNKKLSVGCGIGVAIQCLEALEDVHSIGYALRDVCPANYAIGADKKDERHVLLTDLGHAWKFKDDNGKLKKARENEQADSYAPRNAFHSAELSRRDDIEMWFYMSVELVKGFLPWGNSQDAKDIFDRQNTARAGLDLHALLGGLPKEFVEILRLVDAAKYEDTPEYATIYGLLRKAMRTANVNEFPYDWEAQPTK
ncbi:P34 protein [Aphelenchoides avenae]|nr:P34 protein [Aphelenchus avenae]